MPTLDNDQLNIIDEKSVPFTNTAMRYGLIGGGALIVFSLLSFLVFIPAGGTVLMLSGFLSFGIYIAIVAMAIKFHRDEELGGYVTLGRCVGLGTLAIIIATAISTLFSFIYMNYIDPTVMERIIDASMGMFESMLDEDQLEEIKQQSIEQQSGLMGGLIQPVFFSVFTGLIISAITGLIMRKNPPQMA